MFLTRARGDGREPQVVDVEQVGALADEGFLEHALGATGHAGGGGGTPAGFEHHVVFAVGHGGRGERGAIGEVARLDAGGAQRATQAGQRRRVEIGGHGDHRLDAVGHGQRAQVRVHFQRHVARGVFIAAQLAPVGQRDLVGAPARHGQRHAPEARVAGHGLHRQRLVGDQLAVARDGEGVVVEVQAVHVQSD